MIGKYFEKYFLLDSVERKYVPNISTKQKENFYLALIFKNLTDIIHVLSKKHNIFCYWILLIHFTIWNGWVIYLTSALRILFIRK